ncbi:PREDICTED: uncharacterized protein LOC109341151 [Lupinus angustifolius]|uniref:uncharacterized protein LOC109341151 n=1 Tax=Lupinus angustifolius TaxID=3871 RepID=UPI00092E35B0|nr:PREDICTED: uncharacterized protein LOC109341151 [Lupinus angustifolius]
MDLFKSLQINIPFMEAMEQIPTYAKFMKDLLTKKRKFSEETVTLEARCNVIIQKSLLEKTKDPCNFKIPTTIGELFVGKALLDLDASINLTPMSMLKRIGDLEIKPTRMTLQLTDRSVKYPYGVAGDVLVKVDKLVFPLDFVIMENEEDTEVSLILGRPFMKTAQVIIDVDDGKLKVRVQDQELNFNVFETMQHPKDKQHCFRVDVIEELYMLDDIHLSRSSPLEKALRREIEESNTNDKKMIETYMIELDASREVASDQNHKKELVKDKEIEIPKVELKLISSHLKYVFLEDGGKKPVIISSTLSYAEEKQLIDVLKKIVRAIGWILYDLHGISPSYYMHKVLMEKDYRGSSTLETSQFNNEESSEKIGDETIAWMDGLSHI